MIGKPSAVVPDEPVASHRSGEADSWEIPLVEPEDCARVERFGLDLDVDSSLGR